MTDNSTLVNIVTLILQALPGLFAAFFAARALQNIKSNTTITENIEKQTNGGFAHLREQLTSANDEIADLKATLVTVNAQVVKLTKGV